EEFSERKRLFRKEKIGWNLLVEKINTFFERQDTRGYKFDIASKGNIFIVEMENAEHAFVVKRLDKYFEVPNGGVADNPPIDILGASAHYKPRGGGKPSASDIAIYLSLSIILKPPTPAPPQCGLRIFRAPRISSQHREIPPVDKTGRPYARIMCEVAVFQKYDGLRGWNDKRSIRNMNGQFDRYIIVHVRLWTRQVTPILGRHIAVAGQPGVYYEESGVLTLRCGPSGTYVINKQPSNKQI
ncbi:13443_t:CDS:2, partial [Funneliformis caledonium]